MINRLRYISQPTPEEVEGSVGMVPESLYAIRNEILAIKNVNEWTDIKTGHIEANEWHAIRNTCRSAGWLVERTGYSESGESGIREINFKIKRDASWVT